MRFRTSFTPTGVLPCASLAGWSLLTGALCPAGHGQDHFSLVCLLIRLLLHPVHRLQHTFSTTAVRGPMRDCLQWHVQRPAQCRVCPPSIDPPGAGPLVHDADALSAPSHPLVQLRRSPSLAFSFLTVICDRRQIMSTKALETKKRQETHDVDVRTLCMKSRACPSQSALSTGAPKGPEGLVSGQ